MTRGLMRWVVAAALALAALPGLAETTVLTPDQTRALAFAAHRAQNPQLAAELALVLIGRDPGDSLAHQILGAARYAMGDYAGSLSAGKAGYRSARTARERHDAAMIVAEAAFKQQRIGAARFWLRRAAEAAPDAGARANAIRIFRGVGAEQRLTTRLDFGIAPNSNINGGASGDTVLIFGIPFTLSGDARALSGIEARAAASLSWKLSESANHRTDAGGRVTGRVFELSRAAKAQAPGASGSDYAFASAEVFLRHAMALPGATGPTEATLTIGHNWYGGSDLSDYGRIDLSQTWASGGNIVRLSGGVERQERRDQATRSATILSLAVMTDRALASGDRWQIGASFRDTRARSTDTDHVARGVNLGYTIARPILGAQVSTQISIEERDFGRTLLAPGGRDDLRLTGTLSLFFPNLDYMGFAPVLDLRASRNRSNVGLHDSEDYGVSLSVRSSF